MRVGGRAWVAVVEEAVESVMVEVAVVVVCARVTLATLRVVLRWEVGWR